MKYCRRCGNIINESVQYCTNCGYSEPAVEPNPIATNGQGTFYQGLHDNGYNRQSNLEEPVSVGEWIVMTLILMVPLVNIIMLFVWAFGGSAKKSKSNYCKANLILCAIGVGIYVVIFIIAIAAGLTFGSLADSYRA